MFLIIYISLIIILVLYSRFACSCISPRHAVYVQIINPAVSSLMRKLNKGKSLKITRDFILIYGRREAADGMVREIDVKISSLLTFMIIPAVVLTFTKPKTIEWLVCAAALVLGYYLPEMDLKQKANNIKDSIMRDFPVFCMDLAILCEAGTGLEAAWEKALEGKPHSIFNKEAAMVKSRTEAGMSFEKSLILFARRYGIPEIYTFSSMIGQSLKTGSSNVVTALREYSMHSWEGRLARAREKGDKASVKMILPLIMGLTGIILILAYPAFAVMKGMI
jgi:pilus assembly protein TadC